MEDLNTFTMLGSTRDDAAGEAFDKVSRFLNLGYPGGPAIQKAATLGQAGIFKLPRAYLDREDFEFSFSGLKTATINLWKKQATDEPANAYHLAAEFQAALVDVLVEKTLKAAQKYNAASILIAGGVAANSSLRQRLSQESVQLGIPLFYPSLKLCTDNAAMIAGLGCHFFVENKFADLSANAFANVSAL
jgi:N6-L-threonylcarbamoyladenine synthase